MMSAAEMFLELVVHVMVGVMIITVEAGAFFLFLYIALKIKRSSITFHFLIVQL